MLTIPGGWLVELKNKRKGLRFGRDGPDLGSGDQELPYAVDTRHSCLCSISVALVLPHQGFSIGPVMSEDVCVRRLGRTSLH